MTGGSVRERLAAGPARGLGCAVAVSTEAVRDGSVLRELVRALGDGRAVVVARAANSLKKVQKADGRALDGYAGELIAAGLACEVPEARWNLWCLLGGLRLTAQQKDLAVDALFRALGSGSALERVHSMQALFDLSAEDSALRGRVRHMLERALGDASAAVRARARLLRTAR